VLEPEKEKEKKIILTNKFIWSIFFFSGLLTGGQRKHTHTTLFHRVNSSLSSLSPPDTHTHTTKRGAEEYEKKKKKKKKVLIDFEDNRRKEEEDRYTHPRQEEITPLNLHNRWATRPARGAPNGGGSR